MGLLRRMRKIYGAPREVEQLQSAVEEVLSPLRQVPIIDGVLISNVSVLTTDTPIDHLLNRQPVGWFIVDNDTDATFKRVSWNSRTITLQASSVATASIWVF